MNCYYMVRDADLPTIEQNFGRFHYIDLASHGPAGDKWNLLVLEDNHVNPAPAWIALPSLLDAKTTLRASAIPDECLADIGLTGEETTLEAVQVMGEIFPAMFA